MKKDTKKTITTLLKRTAFLFSIAFLIYSCDNDDLEFECPLWELNIGDACADGTNIDGTIMISGFLDASCNCISSTDTTSISYECPSLMLNIGDNCGANATVDSNCECVTNQDSTNNEMYDCPDLMSNVEDSCWVTIQGSTFIGVVTSDCECYSETSPTFDCPDLMQNFGDSCWVIGSDSIYVVGVIDLNCACN